MTTLSMSQRRKVTDLLEALIDQTKAEILVEPYRRASGFWFGGGNLVEDEQGTLWLCGRYRNFGDSRTGLEAGERGLECALFQSRDGGRTFVKRRSWSKQDLSTPEARVLSIEGSSLHRRSDGVWELFVSTEKERVYPPPVQEYLKPGCGVWSIDVFRGPSPLELDPATLSPALVEENDPGHIHVKDPVVYDALDGSTHVAFCSHPYCWSCANTGLAVRRGPDEPFSVVTQQMVPRGATWDVASTRVTCCFRLPRLGVFATGPQASVLLYDGLECVRQHDENRRGVARPRGYSCEEISGAMAGFGDDANAFERLSDLFPLFTSPWGTGASRYADVLVTEQGLVASWEQSQDDLSQPLVGTRMPLDEVERLLS